MRKKLLVFAVAVFLAAAMLQINAKDAFGRDSIGIVLAPFEVNAPTDISDERRNLMEAMAVAFAAEGAELKGLETLRERYEKGQKGFSAATAAEIARLGAAEFAVAGSISLAAGIYTVNWSVVEPKSGAQIVFYTKSSNDPEELVTAVTADIPGAYAAMNRSLGEKFVNKEDVISRITVTGAKRIDEAAVLKKVGSKTGERFSAERVREDMRAIFQLGYFDDVSAELLGGVDGQTLNFMVKEKPVVKSVVFKGNDKVATDKIKEVLTIKEATILNRQIVNENAERIRVLYEQKGFFLASIKPEILEDEFGASVVYGIEEGAQVKIKSIIINGNRAISTRKIKQKMQTKKKGLFSFITDSGNFDRYTFDGDLYAISSLYMDKGFIKFDITGQNVVLSEDKKWFDIVIDLNEGNRYRVGEIKFSGELISLREKLYKKVKLKEGAVFNRQKLIDSVDNLEELYGDSGYAYADVKPVTDADENANVVSITFDIKKNELVYVERVDIRGNTKTKDKVIRRELELGEGDLYSSSAFKSSRHNLNRLGYFSDVKMTKSEGAGPNKMKLDVEVKEQPTGSVTFGLGYSSSDKLVFNGSVSQSNFWGTGVMLNLSAMLSSKSTSYTLGVTEPWLFDKPLSAGFDIYNNSRDYGDFTEKKIGFDVRFGFPLYKRNTRAFLTYRHETVKISDISALAPAEILAQEGVSTLNSLTTMVAYDTRDDFFFPREGANLWGSVELAGTWLGGDNNFVKYETGGVKYFPMAWDTALSFRANLGYVKGLQGQDVPINEKYYVGGMNSVRGFETRSLGPVDPVTGEVYGGNTKAVFNTEYLYPLMPEYKMKGVVFFDMGNAFDGPIDLGNLRKGAGFGIRWYSPMGPLRIEWGYNLSRKKGERASMWELTMGGIF